ncbi:hypothetical protein AAFF_G00255320 [Aldrovandia affinis]|uniref:Uncharacterized protein n=1 Tax=Aldrovandia affinis TaxID=143900 RepID=A0AAD7RCL3_9TELE|nr:hypothetical protein AAFF_G00255320 [Aldrovandia affinis]
MVEYQYSSFLKRYEEESKSKFIIKKIHAHFNDKEWQPPTGIQKVYWEWKKDNTPSIPFSGVPFIFVGVKSMMCHQGKDKAAKKKRKYAEAKLKETTQDHSFRKRRFRLQDTKKVGCPAEVHITRICRFPAFKLDENRERARKAAAVRLRKALKRDPIVWEDVYIVKIPTASAHVGHPVELTSTVVTDTADTDTAVTVSDLPHRRKSRKGLLRRECISTLKNIIESVYLLDNETTLLSYPFPLPSQERKTGNQLSSAAILHCCPPPQLPTSTAPDLHSFCPELPTSTAAHLHSCRPPQLLTSTAPELHSFCPELPTFRAAHLHSC